MKPAMKTYLVDKKECDSEAVEYFQCFAFSSLDE